MDAVQKRRYIDMIEENGRFGPLIFGLVGSIAGALFQYKNETIFAFVLACIVSAEITGYYLRRMRRVFEENMNNNEFSI